MGMSPSPRAIGSLAAAAVLLLGLPAQAAVTEWVDVRIENGLVYVATEVAGIPGWALIDTGAEVNAVNEHFIAKHDLEFDTGRSVQIVGVHGQAERRVFTEVPTKLFGSEFAMTDLVELDIGGPEVQLILGAGFLKLFVFQFDYPNERMRAITRDSIDLKAVKNIESQQDRRRGSPMVKARLNDQKDLWLLIDTGSNGGILIDRKTASRAGWLRKFPLTEVRSSGVNASAQLEAFQLPVVSLGPFAIENTTVRVPLQGQSLELLREKDSTGSRVKRRRSRVEGILGYDVLRHFTVTIDYQEGHVHLQPGGAD